MNDKVLIDTNVLITAYDPTVKKHEKTKETVKHLWSNGLAVTTSQILSEFYYATQRKAHIHVEKEIAKQIVQRIIESRKFQLINYSETTVLQAIELKEKHKTHFWDALIAATMLENNVTSIVTENVKDFKKIPQIKVKPL